MPSAPTTRSTVSVLPSESVATTRVAAVVDLGDRGAEPYVDPGLDHLVGQDVGDVAADRAHGAGQVRAAHRGRRDLGDHVAVGGLEPQVAEREAALGQPVVDADGLERLERVALQRDAVADAAELGAQVDEDDLDALLPECEREHAAGDATADDEDAVGRSWDSDMSSPGGEGGGPTRARPSGRGRRRPGPSVAERLRKPCSMPSAWTWRTSTPAARSSSTKASPVVRRSSYSAVTSTVGARPVSSARAGKE